jgi:hypothetical protein
MSTTHEKLQKQIEQTKRELQELGPMRPGAISRQFRNPREKKRPFYQISYTRRMKSRSEYLRPENLAAVRRETSNFKRFRKLVDRWVALALRLSQLKTRQGLHSESA